MRAASARFGRPYILLLVCAAIALGTAARSQESSDAETATAELLQVGISVDSVSVSSDFAGHNIVVFGSIENADKLAQVYSEYAIVVAIRGPAEEIFVRRKERIFGVWVNRQYRRYRHVPSFYTVASSRPLDGVAPKPLLRQHQLGVDNLSLSLFSSGTDTFILPAPEFAASLRRIRKREGLFNETSGNVEFLGSSLFRATLYLPSNVPIGKYDVATYLFRNGELLTSRVGSFEVEKVGFEKWIYALAHSFSFWYGVIAVITALAIGWLGSVIFGNRR
jgi:uncharacterized protein (TIGR02186 family)